MSNKFKIPSQLKSGYWSKKGGYAGQKTIHGMRQKLMEQGWTEGSSASNTHPAYDIVSNSDTLVSPDGSKYVEFHITWGVTSYDNYFSAELIDLK